MIKFSNLLDDLLLSPSKKTKVKILVNYFNSLDIDEKAWAFSILTGKFSNKYIKAMDIKNMIKDKISNDLFSYSYDYVGDLALNFFTTLAKEKKIKKNFVKFFYEKNYFHR